MPGLPLLLLLLALARYSSATYCLCKDGISDSVLQLNIDYACHNGADCSPIQPNAACYNPSTVKDHCNYAVNSYFQKKGQIAGSCDFSGSATTSTALPAAAAVTGCTYPTSSGGTSTAPSTPTTSTSTTPSMTGSTFTPPPLFNGSSGTVLNNTASYGKATSLQVYDFKLMFLCAALLMWH